MFRKAVQLGLVHTAVAMTLVPINSTLNRVMIKELSLSATLVVLLASLPYLFSPIQVAIGSYSDSHPLFSRRRTPYILLGLILCATGLAASPLVAFLLEQRFWMGLGAAVLAFGAWGMGYNFAAVSYLALATEMSGANNKGRILAIMWCMMICGIIATSLVLGRLLDPYSPGVLSRSFLIVAASALLIGCIGLIGLEPAFVRRETAGGGAAKRSWGELLRHCFGNPQAVLFFIYLILLLSAVFGQDLLLEPFAGEVLKMPVSRTTRLTAIWGSCFLASMILGSQLERRVAKKKIAFSGNTAALFALLTLVAAGVLQSSWVFYLGTIMLGLGSGISTVANLSLMLDMTLPGREGLFMGLWGIASAAARVAGSASGGILRDLLDEGNPVTGYAAAFGFLAALLAVSLILLGKIDVPDFRDRARLSILPSEPRIYEALD